MASGFGRAALIRRAGSFGRRYRQRGQLSHRDFFCNIEVSVSAVIFLAEIQDNDRYHSCQQHPLPSGHSAVSFNTPSALACSDTRDYTTCHVHVPPGLRHCEMGPWYPRRGTWTMIMMRGEGWCGSGDPGRFLELDRQYQVFYSIILPIFYCDDETTPSLCFCDTVHTTAL